MKLTTGKFLLELMTLRLFYSLEATTINTYNNNCINTPKSFSFSSNSELYKWFSDSFHDNINSARGILKTDSLNQD